MKMHRIVKENSGITLKDIEHGYGKEAAKALQKYCSLKNLDIDEVVSDTKTDGNGMTPWDKFDVWAQKNGVDIMGNFDDTYDWSGAEERERRERERAEMDKEEDREIKKGLREIQKNKKELRKMRRQLRRNSKANRRSERFGNVYQAPTDFSTMNESGGSRMDENDILDWIFQEMGECEWAGDMEYVDDETAFEVSIPGPDGDVFKVSVTKV